MNCELVGLAFNANELIRSIHFPLEIQKFTVDIETFGMMITSDFYDFDFVCIETRLIY